MPHDPGHELDRNEHQVHDQPDQRGTLASFCGARPGLITSVHAHFSVQGDIPQWGRGSVTTAGQNSGPSYRTLASCATRSNLITIRMDSMGLACYSLRGV